MSLMTGTLKIIKFSIPLVKENLLKRFWAITLSYVTQKPIRISFSYLHLIERGNEILLVYSKKGKYQPPGGVYKGRRNALLFNSKITQNDYITEAPKDDYRAILNSPRFLSQIYDEFLSGNNREKDFSREYEEELLESKILPKRLFSWKKVEATQIKSKVVVELGEDVVNFYHYDIVNIELNNEQLKYLCNNPDYKIGKYVWLHRKDLKKKELILKSKLLPKSIQDHDHINISPHSKYLA